jgi:hypothetical protein
MFSCASVSIQEFDHESYMDRSTEEGKRGDVDSGAFARTISEEVDAFQERLKIGGIQLPSRRHVSE